MFGRHGSYRGGMDMSDFDRNFNRMSKGIGLFGILVTVAVCGIFALIVIKIGGTVASGNRGVVDQARGWATAMGLEVIGAQCAGMDSDGDGYVSCTVSSREAGGTVKLTPVECAVSFMPDGCRIPKPANVYGVRQGY